MELGFVLFLLVALYYGLKGEKAVPAGDVNRHDVYGPFDGGE